MRRALERYNGAIGRREYPDRVIVRWTTYWNGADDLGRAAAQPVLNSVGQLRRVELDGFGNDLGDLGRRGPDP